jgi:hypothetical protein
MTTAIQSTDSFYVERLRNMFLNEGYDKIGNTHNSYWGNRQRIRLPLFTQHTITDITFDEQEYRGFQLVIIGWHYEMRSVLDLLGNTSKDYLQDSEIGGYSKDVELSTTYLAYAWEIGGQHDSVTELKWLAQGSAVSGIGCSNSLVKTSKIGMKKIDILADVKSARTEITSINNDRIYGNDVETPYNVLVGDQVFVQAFGRLRNGVIVKTTGGRFIVGYSTPSNPNELKYKTLPLSQLYVRKKV